MAEPPDPFAVPFAPGWRLRSQYLVYTQRRGDLWWVNDPLTLAEGRGTTERDAYLDYCARLGAYLTAVEHAAARRDARSMKLFQVLLRFFAKTDPTLF